MFRITVVCCLFFIHLIQNGIYITEVFFKFIMPIKLMIVAMMPSEAEELADGLVEMRRILMQELELL